jgi:hypothetical protein
MTSRNQFGYIIAGCASALLITACAGGDEPESDGVVQEELEAFAQKLEEFHEDSGYYPDDAERVEEFTATLSEWPITAEQYATEAGSGLGNGRESNYLYCFPGDANNDQYAVVALSQAGTAFAATPDGVSEVDLSNPEHSADICADSGSDLGTGSVGSDNRYWVYPQGNWRNWVDPSPTDEQ